MNAQDASFTQTQSGKQHQGMHFNTRAQPLEAHTNDTVRLGPKQRLSAFVPASASTSLVSTCLCRWVCAFCCSQCASESGGLLLYTGGLWRKGSASDSRTEGWELESLWPRFMNEWVRLRRRGFRLVLCSAYRLWKIDPRLVETSAQSRRSNAAPVPPLTPITAWYANA